MVLNNNNKKDDLTCKRILTTQNITHIELSWPGIEISVKSDNISPTLQSLMENSKYIPNFCSNSRLLSHCSLLAETQAEKMAVSYHIIH